MRRYLDFIGNIGLFALRATRRALVPPFEFRMILGQLEVTGWESLPLVLSSGFAVGLILALHTRSTLIQFGAEGRLPTVESLAFFNEIGPLVAGLLVAGRVGGAHRCGVGGHARNGTDRRDRSAFRRLIQTASDSPCHCLRITSSTYGFHGCRRACGRI